MNGAEAVGEISGPTASLASEDGVLHKWPEPTHDAEAIIEALQRVAAQTGKTVP